VFILFYYKNCCVDWVINKYCILLRYFASLSSNYSLQNPNLEHNHWPSLVMKGKFYIHKTTCKIIQNKYTLILRIHSDIHYELRYLLGKFIFFHTEPSILVLWTNLLQDEIFCNIIVLSGILNLDDKNLAVLLLVVHEFFVVDFI
jgi:hypothetical protein